MELETREYTAQAGRIIKAAQSGRLRLKRPAQRRKLAALAVAHHEVSIALACQIFGISETCFRYRPRLAAENDRIADLLVELTQAHRRWGFGLCFLVSVQCCRTVLES